MITNPLNDPGALFIAAVRHFEAGHLADAERAFCAIPNDHPRHADALHYYGVCAYRRGDNIEAINRLRAAIAAAPVAPFAYNTLALALRKEGQLRAALTAIDSAIRAAPSHFAFHNTRGLILTEMHLHVEAAAAFAEAVRLHPAFAEGHSNLGKALIELNRPRDAITSFTQALVHRPDSSEVHSNLASAHRELHEYDLAIAAGLKALALAPNFPYLPGFILHDMQHACQWQRLDELIQLTRRQIDAGAPAAYPFAILGVPTTAAEQLHCAKIHAKDKFPHRISNDETPHVAKSRAENLRLRIGYFSSDLHDHATAHLIAQTLENHDRSRFEVFAFSFGPPRDDPWRERIHAACEHFFDVSQIHDDDIVRQARRCAIDIAVDLKGYTFGARTNLFAKRMAPIQVSYLGYPGTMGAPFIDYLIADEVVIPPVHYCYYSERIVTLPSSYQPNDSTKCIDSVPPTRAEHGLPESAFVFCCFNNQFKITPDVFDVWMRLLHRRADSVLWLIEQNPIAVRNLRTEAERRGIDAARLVFATRLPLAKHLARHRLADLFLDTFHYNAHTTASDALWSGLPVVTCLGNTFASRVAASLLRAAGLPELVASTYQEYEALAMALADDPQRLFALREKLIAHRDACALFDSTRYTRNLESAYLAMWERFVRGLVPEHLLPGRDFVIDTAAP